MKLLLYCTKSKSYLYSMNRTFDGKRLFDIVEGNKEMVEEKMNNLRCMNNLKKLNGKIVGECEYELEEIKYEYNWKGYESMNYSTNKLTEEELEKQSCLTNEELKNYLKMKPLCCCKGKTGKAIYVENLHIFNEPRELRFYYQKYKNDKHLYNVEKAPQNMMIVIGKQGDKYALVSIHPEYLCKILNGEKTIEIRKKVLKEMVENENHKHSRNKI